MADHEAISYDGIKMDRRSRDGHTAGRRRAMRALHPIVVLLFAALLAPLASAADYPSRPVKLVVPYPAGGPNDIIARILAQKLSEAAGSQFYVENVPGAGGTLAAGAVAAAPADGYTLLVANQDLIVQPIIKAKVPYDPFKSFVPIRQVVAAPEMIVVHPSLPANDMRELIALLKANPGRYSYASPGYGTTPHLACEWLFKLTLGLDVTHVPFQGAAPAVQSTLAGHTPIFHNVLPAVAPHVRQGTMRGLAVASAARSPFLPQVPTLAEAGIPGHEVGFWIGIFAAAATPEEIVRLLDGRIARSMDLPDVKERLATLGFDRVDSAPVALAAHMQAQTAIWSKVVRDAGIKIE
jgi:tripartite-type tricarboxylate transporter receptor subunit TctC